MRLKAAGLAKTLFSAALGACLLLSGQAAPRSRPATGSTGPARLAKELKANVKKFTVALICYGPQDKPYYRLLLTVIPIERKKEPFEMIRFLNGKQAEKIIDHLRAEGFLSRAGNIANKEIALPKGPAYTLSVSGPKGIHLHEDLGWDLAMLARLDALRKVLDGRPADGMDRLLERLSDQRKKWEAATNWPRANPKFPPADKAFEKFTPRKLIPYVMVQKILKHPDHEGPDGARLACAWFIWKTRDEKGGKLRKALADQIVAVLHAVEKDRYRNLHDYSISAGFLGPLGARENIRKLLTRMEGLDCCYGPALVRGLGECGDLRDVEFLIDTVIDKESDACAGIVNEVLVELSGRMDAPSAKAYTDKAAWQKWWRQNRDRLIRPTGQAQTEHNGPMK